MDNITNKIRNKITKERVLFFLILFLAIIIRLIKWPNMLPNFHVDEAMTAINAKTIAEQGCDMYKTSYPVFFETWKWGGQTAFLTYFMALCIKFFGFNTVSIRMPMLIISILSIVIMYLFVIKLFKNKKIGLIAMFLTAISPWHILQSLYSLDCNMFPHITLIAIYILYSGIDKNKSLYIYLSMIFFALSMYTYGLALYFVPLLLLIIAVYLLYTKKVKIRDVLISVLIYITVSFPIILMYIINFFNIETIQIGKISIPYLPKFERMNDVLVFSNNIPLQLCNNIKNLFSTFILQYDGQTWNAIPFFGTTYVVSLFFAIYWVVKRKRVNNIEKHSIYLIYVWIIIALGIGFLIKDIKVYKINIIWYPLIIIISLGIYSFCEFWKNKGKHIYQIIFTIYLILAFMFIFIFSTIYADPNSMQTFWDKGLIDAVKDVEKSNANKVLVVTYSSYRFFERTKVFIRFATNNDIDEYSNEELIINPNEIYMQYTNKYRIKDISMLKESDLEEYSVLIIPNWNEITQKFIGAGYKLTKYKNYAVVKK